MEPGSAADAVPGSLPVGVPVPASRPAPPWSKFAEPAYRLSARRQTDWGILLVALGVVVVAFMLNVNSAADGVVIGGAQLPEICSAKKAGVPCPGCGLTRSFVLGVRLDPAAFRLHRLGPLLLLLVVAQIPLRAWRLWTVRRPEDLPPPSSPTRFGRWAFPVLVLAFLINWCVNLADQFLV